MTFLMRSGAAVVILGFSLTTAAFAQQATRQQDTPYPGTGRAPACTQLELTHGLRGDECGKFSLTEIAKKKYDRDNQ